MRVLLPLLAFRAATAFYFCQSNQGVRSASSSFSRNVLKPIQVATEDDLIQDVKFGGEDEGKKKSSSKQFDWEKQWYPLAVEEFTDKKKSHAMMFLGNNVVLWHNGEKWSVFEDACPHRGVPLSEGRVESNGELLCSYHAWTFNGEGECTSIPQTLTKEKEKTLLSKACVKSYPVQVRQGLVWVWGSKGAPGSDVAIEASLKSLPIPEELEDPAMKDRITTPGWNFRELPYGWDMFMENVFDPAHVPVSHHKIMGNRYNDALPLSIERVKASTEIPVAEGGKMKPGHEEDAGYKFEVKSFRDGKQLPTYASNEFVPPCLNMIDTYYPDGTKLKLMLYATPTKPGFCRHIGAQFLIKSKDYKKPKGFGIFAIPMPNWLLHPLANIFLHQDGVFLHHQERMLYASSNYAFGDFSNNPSIKGLTSNPLNYGKGNFISSEQDKMVSHFRNWIHLKAGGGVKWGAAAALQPLPNRLPNKELFDVYDAHTKQCSVCTTAVKNTTNLRNLAVVLSALTLALGKSRLLKIAGGLFFAGVAAILEKLRGFYYIYEFSHQSNN